MALFHNGRSSGTIATAFSAVWGGVLCGGSSRRMGADKASLTHLGRSFLDIAVDALRELEGVRRLGGRATSGDEAGKVADRDVEPSERGLPPWVPDVPGIGGPLAGMLAALRTGSDVAWVLLACDLPLVEAAAVSWLVSQRGQGRDVILPTVGGRVHPLLALYEPSALGLLEDLATSGRPAPSRLVGCPGVLIVEPPASLQRCWTNVNTPEELALLGPLDSGRST